MMGLDPTCNEVAKSGEAMPSTEGLLGSFRFRAITKVKRNPSNSF